MGIMDGISGTLGGFSMAGVMQFLMIIVWGIIIIVPITVIALAIRNHMKYAYTARVFKRRQGDPFSGLPQSKKIEGKAGYFKRRKTGQTVFRIKFGKMPWQQIEVTKMPNPDHMQGNEVTYLQVQKDNFIQARSEIDWQTATTRIYPVEDDTTYGVNLDMKQKGTVLSSSGERFKQNALMVGGMVMLLVAGIIVFYFLSKA